uniref:Uncharacterized protein n=1 Tax=Lotharella oceanica TaxID=641309 RepID=A0A7S2TLS9_9EUKA|mmetsp:Transcript_17617/g.33449  ORF Transcript_17617/g.33449 Transcript_17617/m.33449 type:complete len:151 (+) Transcript_17617:522-974(+)
MRERVCTDCIYSLAGKSWNYGLYHASSLPMTLWDTVRLKIIIGKSSKRCLKLYHKCLFLAASEDLLRNPQALQSLANECRSGKKTTAKKKQIKVIPVERIVEINRIPEGGMKLKVKKLKSAGLKHHSLKSLDGSELCDRWPTAIKAAVCR